MSRIGRSPINIPAGVDVKIDGQSVVVKGTKGTLSMIAVDEMAIEIEENQIIVKRREETIKHKSLHGLTRSLIANMVTGVSEGYKKELEIQGVGYKAEKKGSDLVLSLGFSHPIIMKEPDGVTVEVPAATKLVVSGADKQAVGQFAAQIREKRKPEPYHGKGIRYVGEHVAHKEGKTGSTS